MVIGLLVAGWIAFGATIRAAAVEMFEGNTSAIRMPFVADLLAVELAGRIVAPAGTDPTPVKFVIEEGQTVPQIEDALIEAGLLTDRLAFQYLIISQGLEGLVTAGTYTLNATMSPRDLVDRLKGSPDPVVPRVTLALREGLRIEQIVGLLEQLGLRMEAKDFYRLVSDPPDELVDEYEPLRAVPEGHSLEGFLGAGIFEIPVDITPMDLVRLLLDDWQADIGDAVIPRVRRQKEDLYEVLTLASIVERETGLDSERARIAGVYLNRLDEKLNPTRIMNADPTVIYAVDTLGLRRTNVGRWQDFAFWTTVDEGLAEVRVPDDLRSFQTYVEPGLPDWPIASPSLASIEAVLSPDRRRGYLYFYACPGERKHVFARTLRQHERNIAACER
jgi:UPF0755 protein